MPLSEAMRRGLDRPAERAALAGCAALALFYLACLGWFAVHDVPFDQQFYAQREAVRLHIVSANPVSPDQPVPPSDYRHLALLSGWSVVEPSGVWTVAQKAVLAVSLPPPCRSAAVLRLRVTLMLYHGSRTVQALAGDLTLGAWRLHDREAELAMALPAAAIEPSGLVRLRLLSEKPVRPPGDSRQLGISLQNLTVSGCK